MPMQNNSTAADMRVALLYQTSHLGGHLKDALKEFGANVVYEAPPADIDRDKLEGSGARVVKQPSFAMRPRARARPSRAAP